MSELKWRFRRSVGMASWTYGDMTWKNPCWKVQLYWPEVVLTTGECRITASTVIRLVVRPTREVGFGCKVLGFGCGIVRHPKGVTA